MIWNKRITLMAIGIILFILLVITLKHLIGPIELSRGNEEGFIGEIYGEKNISLKINDSVIYPYGDTFLGIDVLGKRQEYLLLKINNHYVGLGEDSSVMIDGWIVTYKYCRNDTYHFFVGRVKGGMEKVSSQSPVFMGDSFVVYNNKFYVATVPFQINDLKEGILTLRIANKDLFLRENDSYRVDVEGLVYDYIFYISYSGLYSMKVMEIVDKSTQERSVKGEERMSEMSGYSFKVKYFKLGDVKSILKTKIYVVEYINDSTKSIVLTKNAFYILKRIGNPKKSLEVRVIDIGEDSVLVEVEEDGKVYLKKLNNIIFINKKEGFVMLRSFS